MLEFFECDLGTINAFTTYYVCYQVPGVQTARIASCPSCYCYSRATRAHRRGVAMEWMVHCHALPPQHRSPHRVCAAQTTQTRRSCPALGVPRTLNSPVHLRRRPTGVTRHPPHSTASQAALLGPGPLLHPGLQSTFCRNGWAGPTATPWEVQKKRCVRPTQWIKRSRQRAYARQAAKASGKACVLLRHGDKPTCEPK